MPAYFYNVHSLGLEMDPRENRFAALSKAKISDLNEFYLKKIQPKAILFSIVGNQEKIDMQALGKLGEIKHLEPSDLFRR